MALMQRGREVYHSYPYRIGRPDGSSRMHRGKQDLRAHQLTDEPSSRTPAEPDVPAAPATSAGLRVEFRHIDPGAALPTGLLAAVRFGPVTADEPAVGSPTDPLLIDVGLTPLSASTQRAAATETELWWASGAVRQGRMGAIRYAHDDRHLFAVLELDEREHGGINATAAAAYEQLRRFQQQSAFPHLLRVWNYLDAINQGAGDLERYREFCVGRTRGLADASTASYPAATGIGHQQDTGRLQIYWLASCEAGRHIENPRQVSAYRYPRDHGPASPTFARATLASDGTLLISGTASIVGHVSQHGNDPLAQLDETLRNVAAMHESADGLRAARPDARDLLKVYLRNAGHLGLVRARLQHAFPGSPAIYLAADICRGELLLEIECLRLA